MENRIVSSPTQVSSHCHRGARFHLDRMLLLVRLLRSADRSAILVTEEKRFEVVDWATRMTPTACLSFQLRHFAVKRRLFAPKLWIMTREGNLAAAVVAIVINTVG